MTGVKVIWSSGNLSQLSVDSTGLATALVTDISVATRVIAKYGRAQREAPVALNPPRPFNVWPDTNVLFVRMTRTLTGRLIHSPSGYPSPNVEPVNPGSWTSSDASVVTVNGSGQITARGLGHAMIVAVLDGYLPDTVDVYVSAAPAPPLRFTMVSGGQVEIRTTAVNPPFGPDYASRACGLATDGGVYCWGAAADWMEITDRCERTVRSGPARYSLYRWRCTEIPQRIPTTVSFSSLAARGEQSCAIATTRRVYCWGTNRSGELGIGTTDTTTHGVTPVASADEFRSVHVQEDPSYVCAIRTDGAGVCWGGAYGSTPKALTGGVTWRAMAEVGRCGLAADSTAYCFPGGAAERVGGDTRWATIATARYPRLCALAPSGRAYCGSDGSSGGTAFPSLVSGDPLLVSLSTYSPIVTNLFLGEVCGLSAGGDMYCVQDSSTYSLKPVNLGGVKLKRFFAHCGIAADDKAYCWWFDELTRTATFKVVPGQ